MAGLKNPTQSSGASGFAIYRARDAQSLRDTDMLTYANGSVVPESPPGVDRGDGSVATVLFRQPGGDEFSLIHAWFKPHYILPRHSHDQNCLYYIISGEALLGRQSLRAGDGFFVPADHPYAYRAGAEGVEVLEFRHANRFDIKILEERPEAWQRIFEMAKEHGHTWRRETIAPSWRAVRQTGATSAAG